jgi:hypothetical protein
MADLHVSRAESPADAHRLARPLPDVVTLL